MPAAKLSELRLTGQQSSPVSYFLSGRSNLRHLSDRGPLDLGWPFRQGRCPREKSSDYQKVLSEESGQVSRVRQTYTALAPST